MTLNASLRRTPRRVLTIGGGILLAMVLVWAFTQGRKEIATEREREAPVVPPTRVQRVGDQASIVLDAATERRIEILTQSLARGSGAGAVMLTGELMQDPGAVSTVRAPLAGRLMTVGGNQWPTVGQSVSSGRILGQVSDARPLTAARSGIISAVTSQPGELVQPGQQLLAIVNFDRPIARVVWRSGAPSVPPRSLTVTPLGVTNIGSRADYIGPAVDVDSLTRSPVFLYRLAQAWLGARPGLPVAASVPDIQQTLAGVFVPAAAGVQWNGFAWVYVQRGEGRYLRVRLDTSTPVPGGWLAASGVAVGDRVVVRGAEVLLSEEFRSGMSIGQEEGKN